MDTVASIGLKIKELRSNLGLTLQQVADKAGCTAAHISQIENDKTSPSIATLKRIAKVLGVRIVDFFMGEIKDDPVVMNKEQWLKVSLPRWRADIRQMVRAPNHRKMQPFYTVIQPGGGAHEPYSHEGEEFGLVLEGTLVLILDGQSYEVKAGMSFYYSSLLPHAWINEGQEPCRVVWVVSPPSW
ncbi:MAG: helix-turn-helix transcriptional regulator [Deltaproteobacteria bacterium]|nr:helix-turn-helix transcriptional regulator [Deltaproteobacteria bacterium]